MHKTLLLCFIHGFKGGDDTFGKFPEDLRALVEHALPNLTVKVLVYPKYETRGDLTECVSRFREWLLNKVIDLEVAASTPSPTVDPSVHTILIGHSMGGIVAAETFLAICSDAPIPPSPSPATFSTANDPSEPLPSTAAHTDPAHGASTSSLLFPYINGILAFDTPYLGISPSVIAYGAESQLKNASSTYSAFTSATSFFGAGASSKSKPTSPTSPSTGPPPQALPAPNNPAADSTDAAATPAWQRWGKYAMFAGAAGAVAAGGAAAYLKREKLTEGWGWIGSHLEFVGCLAKPEELRQRLESVGQVTREKGAGFRNVVTMLGKNANHAAKKEMQPVRMEPGSGGTSATAAEGQVEGGGRARTFCTIPRTEGSARLFEKSVNDLAKDETEAHMTMFERKGNSHYYLLSERAKELLTSWIEDGEWYRTSEPLVPGAGAGGGGIDTDLAAGKDGGGGGGDRRSFGGLMDVDLNDDDKETDDALKDSVWVDK